MLFANKAETFFGNCVDSLAVLKCDSVLVKKRDSGKWISLHCARPTPIDVIVSRIGELHL